MQPGCIVSFRDRHWVLLPSDNADFYQLRPLTGLTDEVVAVHSRLSETLGYTFPEERLATSQFPAPTPDDISDAARAHLLWHAARLMLRDGAAPFRALGRISIRPRLYQLVPLLMALRLDPVRLFIADDVGVGKTIEALLIARELYDRGEIRRLAVLCPPYLCDQWEKELREKFNLDATVFRTSTISQLERSKPAGQTIYEYYPIQVISIDWVKTDRNKHLFLQSCPDLVIVDEAHGAAEASDRNSNQQQRHRLLKEIADLQDPSPRHLILLTATPHSGIESAFRSLLGLLKPEFRDWDLRSISEPQRDELAKHFIQRTRGDIQREEAWDSQQCFPVRDSQDATYSLSTPYEELFDETYEFCRELISKSESLDDRKRRVRHWGALALLRCVMSSPAAAATALEKRAMPSTPPQEEEPEAEPNFSPFVFESSTDLTDDENPTPPIELTELHLPDADRTRLRKLAKKARNMEASGDDTKYERCKRIVQDLLKEDFCPVIWCRYVATADYVGNKLRQDLGDSVQVLTLTGRLSDDERRKKIEDLDPNHPRVLVATDCLSEGINLQEMFNAVLHYDLPWNPNRLEQREGRVDRYGQPKRRVKVVRFYGKDNPVDGAVLEVLLNKAKEIYRTLGTFVPVPEESESVMNAIFQSLFRRPRQPAQQLTLFDDDEQIRGFHELYDAAARREKESRSRFAQRAIKVQELKPELEATDAVLGTPRDVELFVLSALQLFNIPYRSANTSLNCYRLTISQNIRSELPPAIQETLPPLKAKASRAEKGDQWHICFESPTPEGATYLGRNHPFVAALARYLFEEALEKGKDAKAARLGVLRTTRVSALTAILLLRARYLLTLPDRPPTLSEEVLVLGKRIGHPSPDAWLDDAEARRLLQEAQPEQNIPLAEKR